MHWNSDNFREHATLCEVWFRESANLNAEHRWAQALIELAGVQVPILKFEANDYSANCQSHFVYLPHSLSTAVFRTQLASKGLPTDVLVKFIQEPNAPVQDEARLERQYFVSRRFLELRCWAIHEIGADEGH